jgi:hypothetical protein
MRKGRNFGALQCLVLVLTACLFSHLSYSQKVTNVDFEVQGNTVKINYDLHGCPGQQTYDIKLSLGQNGVLTEITRGLSGDVKDVWCGSSKVILWDVLSDRDELKGSIYFAVEIAKAYPVVREPIHEEVEKPDTDFDRNEWARRSWKADKGYVGGSIGLFAPYQNYSATPYSPQQNGFFLNTSIAYLPSLLLGISSTVYFYGAPKVENLRISTWKSWGVMIGPLISLPIGNKIKWEVKPQIGYSMIFPNSSQSDIDSLDRKRSGIAYNISTGLRLNFGKRTCYMINVEYLSATHKFEHYQVEPDLGVLGASFGIAFRFY